MSDVVVSAAVSPALPGVLVVIIDGEISPAGIPRLCERVRGLLRSNRAEVAVCLMGTRVRPDLAAVDALARLQLSARRLGCALRLGRGRADLERLLAIAGLGDVVPVFAGSRLEARRQPEEREEPARVEKEADPGDSLA